MARELVTIEAKLKAKAKRKIDRKASMILQELHLYLNGSYGYYVDGLWFRQGDKPENFKYVRCTLGSAKELIKKHLIAEMLPKAEQDEIDDFYNKVMKGED